MTRRYWTFGTILFAYTLVELSFDFGEMARLTRLAEENGFSLCRLPRHPPSEIFLLAAALLSVFNPRTSHPFLLFLGGLVLTFTIGDLYSFFLTPYYIFEATGQFGFPRFWLGEGGIRVFPRLAASVFLLGFSIRGLWAEWKMRKQTCVISIE